jgi:hypothetical protein
VPAELTADLPDERRLGVPLAGIRIDGQAIALDDSRLGDGLYALEADAGWRWTDGDARLLLGPDGAADLELTVPFTARYAMQGSGVGRAGDEGRFRSGMRPD